MTSGVSQPPPDPGTGGQQSVALLSEERRKRSGEMSPTGGSGGPTDDMERRVTALEKGQELILSRLGDIADGIKDLRHENERRFGGIEGRLTGIEKILDSKASTADLRELSGKVSGIPTTWQIIAIIAALLVGIGGLSFTISGLRQSPPQSATTAPAGKIP